jgi:transposase
MVNPVLEKSGGRFRLPNIEGLAMSDHHLRLTKTQFSRLQPLLLNKPRGVLRVDGRRLIGGIAHVVRNGLMRRGAPAPDGSHEAM